MLIHQVFGGGFQCIYGLLSELDDFSISYGHVLRFTEVSISLRMILNY